VLDSRFGPAKAERQLAPTPAILPLAIMPSVLRPLVVSLKTMVKRENGLSRGETEAVSSSDAWVGPWHPVVPS
jgi:hypothetical protein